jgi:hypothetical protein
MTWLEIALLVCALAGLTAGAFLVAQRPSFWFGIGAAMFKAGLPVLAKYVAKRNPPEIEAKMHECVRRGGTWDNFNKKCRDR